MYSWTLGEGAGVGTCGRACARQGRWPRSRAVGGKKIREKRGRGAQMVCDAGDASNDSEKKDGRLRNRARKKQEDGRLRSKAPPKQKG